MSCDKCHMNVLKMYHPLPLIPAALDASPNSMVFQGSRVLNPNPWFTTDLALVYAKFLYLCNQAA